MSAVREAQLPARVLITGGAGFIGTNLAAHLLDRGVQVRILDSLARRGVESNLEWLREKYPDGLEAMVCDVRDEAAVRAAVRGVDHIYHLAAQVAVTSSLGEPRHDFGVNAQGTLNVLEAARACARAPSIMFASTNKVYGALNDVEVSVRGRRYVPEDEHIAASGIDETSRLEFHSPYGCSKGAAEQYVLDYSRSFGLRTVVLRMSCIYGPHQHGNEDQGWVAHFLRSALAGRKVTLYGSGMQVRDVLFVGDFVEALEMIARRMDTLDGQAFNIGGGAQNTISLLELLGIIQRVAGVDLEVEFDAWRTGDQRFYVSDTAKFAAATGWRPRTSVEAGVAILYDWLLGEQVRIRTAPPVRAAGPQEART